MENCKTSQIDDNSQYAQKGGIDDELITDTGNSGSKSMPRGSNVMSDRQRLTTKKVSTNRNSLDEIYKYRSKNLMAWKSKIAKN